MKSTISTLSLIKFVIALLFLFVNNDVHAQCSPYCTSAAALQTCLDNLNPGGVLEVRGIINLDDPGVVLPIVIPAGVTLHGDYDPISNPLGTLIFSDNYRSQFNIEHYPGFSNMYLFIMVPGGTSSSPSNPTVINSINIRGANKVPTGYNIGYDVNHADDELYCGGILIFDPMGYPTSASPYCSPPPCNGYGYEISNCEISCFSHAGIWVDSHTDEILIKNNYIHHIKANPGKGSGYGIWTRTKSALTSTDNITIQNCIFDDARNCLDGSTGEFNTNFHDNSTTQLCGSVTRHNNSPIYFPHQSASSGCYFFHEIYDDVDYNYCTSQCEPTEDGFGFDDCMFGNMKVENSIFHTDALSFPYPGRYGLKRYDTDTYLSGEPTPGLHSVGGATPVDLWDGTLIASFAAGCTTSTNNDGGWDISTILGTGGGQLDFNFLGDDNPSLFVSTNGFIQFGGCKGITSPVPYYFPDNPLAGTQNAPESPNNIIALCWTDLLPGSSSTIRYWIDGTLLIIEWDHVSPITMSTEYVTGQIVLHSQTDNFPNLIEIQLQTQNISSVTLPRMTGIIGPTSNSGAIAATTPVTQGNHPSVLTKAYFPGDQFGNYPCSLTTINPWKIYTPECWIAYPPKKYNVDVINNTFVVPPVNQGVCEIKPDPQQSNMRDGYARIANNYIESCVWSWDNNNITATGNNAGYKPGIEVTSSPQPPEINLNLTDINDDPLPETTNISVTPGHARVQYLDGANSEYKISITKGSLPASGTAKYLVRRNNSFNDVVTGAANNTTSCNNYFYDAGEITAETSPGTPTILDGSYLYDNITTAGANFPGLYGIDVLAIDNAGTTQEENYYSSAWQHIPLIVTPPNDDHLLIFNIKDNYQEFHHLAAFGNLTTETGIEKRCYLETDEPNSTPQLLWHEDIAFGGDGWERVEISLDPYLQQIVTDGGVNRITFGIYNVTGYQIDAEQVKGVIVWIDDVYLQKYGKPDNLIGDGDIERATCDGLNTTASDNCTWYQGNETTFSGCNPIPSPMYYPDGRLVNLTTYESYSIISHSERKSGINSVAIVLPYIKGCTNYGTYGDDTPLITASTNFDFRGLLDCSEYGNGQNVLPTTILSNTSFSQTSNHPQDAYRCTGDVVVGDGANAITLNLNGITLAIDPEFSITVENHAILNISNNGSISSNLFACKEMWQGIKVKPGGRLSINSNALNNKCQISDAVEAIYADRDYDIAPSVVVRYTEFDRNHIDVHLLNGDFPEGSNPGQTSFRGSTFKCSGGVITKHTGITAPDDYFEQPTYSHFFLEGVTEVQVGDPDVTLSYRNYFSDGNFGIKGEWSNVEAYRNDFTNIGNLAGDDISDIASGIYMSGDAAAATLTAGHAAATGFDYTNSFTNCLNGIVCTEEVNTTIIDNTFTDCGNISISLANSEEQPINIVENTISGCGEGIILYEIQGFINTSELAITGNEITGKLLNGVPTGTHGIAFYNSMPYKIPAEISGNIINDCPIGIGLTNVAVDDHFNLTGNHVNFNTDEYHLLDVNIGLYVTNCTGANVAGNEITWTTPPATEAGINAFAGSVMGIYAVKVQGSDIKDNTITTCGTGMYMYDDCSNTYFTCNGFINCYPGIDFSTTTSNLPAQGDDDNPTHNYWDINTSYNKVEGSPDQFYYYYWGAPDYTNNQEYPNSPSGLINRNQSTNNNSSCSSHQNMMAESEENIDEALTRMIDNPAPASESDFAAEAEYKKQEYAYSTMQEIPGFITTTSREDFMDSTEDNNIGKLKEVKDLILAGEMEEAATKNAIVNDSNIIEQNKKTFNEIILSAAANNHDTITAGDSTTLYQMAHQLAIQGGEAVYWARGKLKLDIIDHFSALRKARDQDSEENRKRGKLYPVPATESVTFIYEHSGDVNVSITITNPVGQVLLNYLLKQKSIDFSIAHLAAGFYYVKVCENGAIKEEHKLTVIR